MKRFWFLLTCLVGSLLLATSSARAEKPRAQLTAPEIVARVLESDPWGLNGGEITATAVLRDKRGSERELSFVAASRQHDPPLSKSLVRFSSPPDLAGAGFLQIQRRDGDDDRYLYLPALKRSRRISGNSRSNAFMGTDFSFADLDRRDLRDGESRLLDIEKIGNSDCYVVEVVPHRSDTQYSRLELWVRTDNFLPLKTKMYDKAKMLLKTFEAKEVRRVSGTWFVSKSLMTNHRHQHTTLLTLRRIVTNTDIPDEEFSVRALEKP